MSWLSTGIAILCILVGGSVVWHFLNVGENGNVRESLSIPHNNPAILERDIPAGYHEYRNEFFRVSLVYPQDITVAEIRGEGTTLTVVFTQPSTDKSFQIYILPYGEEKISRERFLIDMPSGVMENSSIINIGGISAGAFFGEDAQMGRTREVWFIHKGFLYEATASAEDGEWMEEILNSWKFL